MFDTISLKSNPVLKAAMKVALPKYRKHDVTIVDTDVVTPNDACWNGGSRSSYIHCHVNGTYIGMVPAPTAPVQFGGWAAKPFNIPAGTMVLQVGIFRGKTAAAIIYTPDPSVFDIEVES
jgi:hypothetical protein